MRIRRRQRIRAEKVTRARGWKCTSGDPSPWGGMHQREPSPWGGIGTKGTVPMGGIARKGTVPAHPPRCRWGASAPAVVAGRRAAGEPMEPRRRPRAAPTGPFGERVRTAAGLRPGVIDHPPAHKCAVHDAAPGVFPLPPVLNAAVRADIGLLPGATVHPDLTLSTPMLCPGLAGDYHLPGFCSGRCVDSAGRLHRPLLGPAALGPVGPRTGATSVAPM